MSMETELIKIYTKAQADIMAVIVRKVSNGSRAAYEKAMLSEIQGILSRLKGDSAKAIEAGISDIYNYAQNGVYSSIASMYNEAGEAFSFPEPSFTVINRNAIRILIQNATGQLEDMTNRVGRLINDIVRQAGIDAITQKIVSGATIQAAKALIQQKLIENGILSVPLRNGRKMRLDAYATLIARSTTREVTNTATISEMIALGQDLVIMSSHRSACPICAPLEGRVYSISGTTPGYPKLDLAFTGRYANVHPHCRHVFLPYIAEFDKDAEAKREYSNRPFGIDPRSASEKRAYEKAQEYNRELLRDRKQWEAYRIRMGNDAPSTLASFRNIKLHHPEAYGRLQDSYREAGAQIRQVITGGTPLDNDIMVG